MEERIKLYKADKDYECDREDLKLYQELEGSLMHLLVQTRPDITHAVNKFGQFASNPTKQHWTALRRILRYLKGTPDYGLIYGTDGSLTLEPWTDSSWGDDLNDSRSTHGYIFKLAGGPISWKSRKQHLVALSTAEAEYVGESHCGTMIEWLRELLQELDIDGATPNEPTIMHCRESARAVSSRGANAGTRIEAGGVSLEIVGSGKLSADGNASAKSFSYYVIYITQSLQQRQDTPTLCRPVHHDEH